MDKILLIDFHNAVWRASIGFKPKSKVAGEIDWEGKAEPKKEMDQQFVIAFNFFRNLRPIIELFSPDKCFIVEEGHPQFRYDLFPDYKANRIIKRGTAKGKETQDKFFFSKEIIVRLLQYLPITIAKAKYYEADDTIGSLCEDMKDEHLTILSNDGDHTQLLQRGYKHCQVYNPIKKTFFEAPPYLFVPYRCLVGDKSDCIPRLISEKKALACMTDPKKFQEFMSLEENRANFAINRSLIEFRMVPGEEIELKEGIKNFVRLKEEFAKMEFESIINDNSWRKYTNTFNCLKY